MAFVFRATRFRSAKERSGTPARLGPGSYDLRQDIMTRPSLAPFNSTSVRAINEQNGVGDVGLGDALYTPGPGSYIPVFEEARVQSASSSAFRSSTKRFESAQGREQQGLPGPASYGGHQEWKHNSSSRLQRSKSTAAYKRRHPNVKWVRVRTAPSIPARTQSHGYQQNEQGF